MKTFSDMVTVTFDLLNARLEAAKSLPPGVERDNEIRECKKLIRANKIYLWRFTAQKRLGTNMKYVALTVLLIASFAFIAVIGYVIGLAR